MSMYERVFAVRGAVQVNNDDREEIIQSVLTLFDTICERNALSTDHIVSIQFTVTPDLLTINPATALRSRDSSFAIPLFCMQEPVIQDMLPRTIRCLIHYYHLQSHRPLPVYVGGARSLRPDLLAE